MPKKRPPKEVWQAMREHTWEANGRRCQSPLQPPICQGKPEIALKDCHIDHIRSGKLAGNGSENRRVLCRACHALRRDLRHRGMIANAIRDGVIPGDWRNYLWE